MMNIWSKKMNMTVNTLGLGFQKIFRGLELPLGRSQNILVIQTPLLCTIFLIYMRSKALPFQTKWINLLFMGLKSAIKTAKTIT